MQNNKSRENSYVFCNSATMRLQEPGRFYQCNTNKWNTKWNNNKWNTNLPIESQNTDL